MSTRKFTATKDGQTYSNTFVGGNPFSSTKTTTTINFLIVPLIVDINSTTFDPTAADSCITGSKSPLGAFNQSPIFRTVAFDGKTTAGHASLVNGVDIGTVTYADGFRLAEFWSKVAGSAYHTAFRVTTAAPWRISSSDVQNMGGGNVITTGCGDMGVLNTYGFHNYITNTVIPGISAITPTTFVMFLMKDVVTTTSSTLDCSSYCEIGYHSAQGSPVQTYAVAEYDSTSNFWMSAFEDISIITHEIAEWMDDPLVTNFAPPYGNVGQVSGCQDNWEPGDPQTGANFPAIKMGNGITYHPQSLAFWSWFYDAQTTKSLAAGHKFSMNGFFQGPAQPCPPGGSY